MSYDARKRDAEADYAEVKELASSYVDTQDPTVERMAAVHWAAANGLDPKWVERMLRKHQREAAVRNMGYDPERPTSKPRTLQTHSTGGTFDVGETWLSEGGYDNRKGPCAECQKAATSGRKKLRATATGHLH